MTNSVFISFCLIIIFAAFLYILWKITYGKLQNERLKNAVLSRSVKQLEEENGKLREEMKLKARLEKEANEKITAINNGDLSPDDVLPK